MSEVLYSLCSVLHVHDTMYSVMLMPTKRLVDHRHDDVVVAQFVEFKLDRPAVGLLHLPGMHGSTVRAASTGTEIPYAIMSILLSLPLPLPLPFVDVR